MFSTHLNNIHCLKNGFYCCNFNGFRKPEVTFSINAWFKVKFDKEGKANFWVRPKNSYHDVDLYVYKSQSLNSTRLGRSTSNGKGKDELIEKISVKSDRYYYIYVKNDNRKYGEIDVRARNYPESSSGGNSGGSHNSRVGKLYNFKVKSESDSEVYFCCNPAGNFDYFKVYLNGKFHAKLNKNSTYVGTDNERYKLRDSYYFEYVFKGLKSNTSYTVKVLGYKSNGDYGDSYSGIDRTEKLVPKVGAPTNASYVTHADGLGMTVRFNKGSNSTQTIIKNGSKTIKTVSGNSAELRFSSYNKSYTLKLIGVNGSLQSTSTTLIVKTTSKPIEGVKKGDKGNSVKGIQEMLVILKYLSSTNQIDGIFGTTTERAVKAFQRDVNLEAHGVVDNITRGLMADAARLTYRSLTSKIVAMPGVDREFKKKPNDYHVPTFGEYVSNGNTAEITYFTSPNLTIVGQYSIYRAIVSDYMSIDLQSPSSAGATFYGGALSVDAEIGKKIRQGDITKLIESFGVKIGSVNGGDIRIKLVNSSSNISTIMLEYSKTVDGYNMYHRIIVTVKNFNALSAAEAEYSGVDSTACPAYRYRGSVSTIPAFR